MPRLRILAGPSLTELTPIEANSDVPLSVQSDAFEGQVAVYIKDFVGESGKAARSPYFEHHKRKGITWSIQIQGEWQPFFISARHSMSIYFGQGRFLQTHCADDILFGNVFDRPLKLPWGFGAALKFMKYVALIPCVAARPHIHST